MSDASTVTMVTTGMLPVLMLASVALTAPASVFLLWRYRRAVIRSMAGSAGVETATAPVTTDAPTGAGASPTRPLVLRRLEAAAATAPDSSRYRDAKGALRSAIGVYVLAGSVYAIVFAGAWMTFSRADGFPLTRLLWLLSCYAWPTVLAIGIMATVSRGQRALLAGVYLALLLAIGAYALLRNPELTAGQLAFFWIFTDAPATVLLFAFLHRRVRAVGPLVLTFMAAAVTGSQVLLSVIGASDFGMRLAVDVGAVYGLGGTEVFVALIVLGFGAFGVLGWWLLKWIGRCYQRRMMSDQSLTLDAVWLLFAIEQSITFAFEGSAWVFTGLIAFGAYKLVKWLGFKALADTAASGATLLLLRVFALGQRSERLFDALAKRWLRAGSITLIAGPDLVASTVEPHEFLDFIGGQLSRQFVRDRADLEQRLRSVERGCDPDGKYRVNEFFCYADTWQETMRRLATRADAVLMDVRSFSPANQGCIYELEQLLAFVDLRRVVLLVDATTDAGFLERALQAAWQRVPLDSCNRALATPECRLLDLSGQKAAELRALLRVLFADASAPVDAALVPDARGEAVEATATDPCGQMRGKAA